MIAALLNILSSICLCLGCLNAGKVQFEVPPYSIQFLQPASWQLAEKGLRGTICHFTAEPQNGFGSNLIVTAMEFTEEEIGNIAPRLLDINIKKQQRSFPMYEVLEREKRNIGSLNAHFLMTRYAMGQIDIASYQVYILQLEQSRVYNFTFTCLLSELEALRPMLDETIQSIVINPIE